MIHSSRILIVDDEPKAHTLMENILFSEGYTLLHANDGPQALTVANAERPDVILLDVMMPGMDGFDVCRALRENPSLQHVPVILLTALDDRASKLEGLGAGADDYLTKPYDALELRTRLRTLTRLDRFRRLYDERARFEAVVNASPEGIVVAHADGTIVLSNPAFERMVRPADGARNIFDCFEGASTGGWRTELASCQPGHRVPALIDAALVGPRQPGTLVDVTGCVEQADGVPLFHFHVRDVTQRKMLENRLKQSQRIELLGQLAGGIVHDVNNLLFAIHGSAQMLEPSATVDDVGIVKTILTASARGTKMLRGILSFARGTQGAAHPIQVGPLLAEVESIASGAIGRSHTLRLTVEPDLPLTTVDPTDLHQTVMNLCVNARDAMSDGGDIEIAGRLVEVSVADAAAEPDATPGPYVAISVRDFGTGIPPEVRDRIFDPFFTTKSADKGTGLGLASVLRLVRGAGGFVTVETAVGKGTCFTCHYRAA
jgi:CheY-like chemotaxis protein